MPNKRTGEPTKDELLAPVVERLLEENPDYFNWEMAERAAKELGFPVDNKGVSRVRNLIGKGWHDQVMHRALENVFKELREHGWTIEPPKRR